jgi:[1-hydroxy-2-(trimethylamino)ethyl]phosphonate dioxygenase
MDTTASAAKQIAECFALRGQSEYGGEAVTQLEHALQCAWLAEQAGSNSELIVASLLHDIGHLLHDLPADAPDRGIDDHHENSGFRYLEKNFPAAVAEPVRLHVAAKRYLCTVDQDYESQLSEPSLVSLRLQGGKMSEQELGEFRANPFWRDAIELRKWDDLAKIKDLPTPDFMHFMPYIELLVIG